ncbi:hypothetical protein [Sphingopyxis sp. RIFCSPHIGHO2_12_FULL_65_19]|uniref:hypothetical protein n=1 Tax=Sphingopyxis sp. RIFCSPHIGHO2_12_FULL_65_19 TaxID=1802172 RepID=UPI0008AF7D4A|nr:hypothetical protein [Sphingopyxis sp. RIFCSPHIGHO2_12_FULL_65_19]OHD07573.1 MAG: hypothetical protein A3E77_09330 [Sphingopyxis sp. RIFCSPHIGHO2_12_FULL_65_19]
MGIDPLDEPAPGSSVAPARTRLEGFEPHNKVRLSDANRQRVMAALLNGYPKAAIANALSISAKTLDRLIYDDDELLDQVEAQRAFEEAELRDILMELARKGDTVAAIFLAKARHGWRDRDDAKLSVDTGGGGVLVVPGTMPLEQWTAAAALQQAKYRERPDAPLDEREMRTHPTTADGLIIERTLPGDLPG